MKEERKRQKQLESNFEEEYFEDHGGEGIQHVRVCVWEGGGGVNRYQDFQPVVLDVRV